MYKSKLLFITCCVFGLSSCQMLQQMQREQQEQWIAQNCNTDAAYSNGMNDGLTPGHNALINYAALCSTNNVRLNQSYTNGFSDGLRGRPQQVEVSKHIYREEVVKPAPDAGHGHHKKHGYWSN